MFSVRLFVQTTRDSNHRVWAIPETLALSPFFQFPKRRRVHDDSAAIGNAHAQHGCKEHANQNPLPATTKKSQSENAEGTMPQRRPSSRDLKNDQTQTLSAMQQQW